MQVDAQRLQAEYNKLVQGLHVAGVLQQWQRADLENPALPEDILNEAVPGNIRRCAPPPSPLVCTSSCCKVTVSPTSHAATQPMATCVAVLTLQLLSGGPWARIMPPCRMLLWRVFLVCICMCMFKELLGWCRYDGTGVAWEDGPA